MVNGDANSDRTIYYASLFPHHLCLDPSTGHGIWIQWSEIRFRGREIRIMDHDWTCLQEHWLHSKASLSLSRSALFVLPFYTVKHLEDRCFDVRFPFPTPACQMSTRCSVPCSFPTTRAFLLRSLPLAA